MKKKKGAQPRNQNSKKHGFYRQLLDDTEKALIEKAIVVEGIDEEIALLRVKLNQLVVNHPENLELALAVANTITRMVRTKYNISKEQKKSLKEAITRVITDIAIPLGVKILFK
jgi:hypothetical protein